MTATQAPLDDSTLVHIVDGPLRPWYRDLISCLQASFATVLIHAGHEPLEVLGAHWEFLFKPDEVRTEEFYFACRYPGDLGRSLAPHHPVSSCWHRPADDAAPLAEIRAAVAADQLAIAAVDNFYLPFRPAFGDVHAAHLIVVFGLDENRDLVYVCDAMPPAFCGAVPVRDFLRAWSSANPRDVQDAFFSDTSIGSRFLTVTLGETFPEFDAPFMSRLLKQDLELFELDDQDAGWVGEAGLVRFLDTVIGRATAGDVRALVQTYTFGWSMQAQSSLHGELLREWGATHDIPEVREAGRLVDAVAHAWTGLRVTAAHGRCDPPAAAADLTRHARALHHRYQIALAGIHEAKEAI